MSHACLLLYAQRSPAILELITSSLQAMQDMQSEYHLESFKESDLLVNITRHFLVPKHTIMTPAEKTALIQR